MPIVITPTGQFIDSVTGNPVDLPPQRPDLPMQRMAGAMSDKKEICRDYRRMAHECLEKTFQLTWIWV